MQMFIFQQVIFCLMALLMSVKLSGYILKHVGEESFTLKDKEMSAVL